MTDAVCPYCRCPIDLAAGEQLVCAGCGTPHHRDCYAENGGCTVFGCGAAPPDEAKLSVSGNELSAAVMSGRTYMLFPVASATTPTTSVTSVTSPPPPPNGSAIAPSQTVATQYNVGNVRSTSQPYMSSGGSHAADFDLTPNPDAKNRTTFILLGVLLGIFGAHNFYAGYRGKAFAQLCISILTLGFASPMAWVWAVIDVCTIDEDSSGVKFRS